MSIIIQVQSTSHEFQEIN